MKLIGAVLILLGAVYGYLVYRRSVSQTLQLLRALADDLPLLQWKICVQRHPLPAILAENLRGGISGACLWQPLERRLAQARESLAVCWDQTMDELPVMIAQRLAPLGKLLPLGGDTLSEMIGEVHRELLQMVQEQERQQKLTLRLSAAVSFSAAALLILVLV